MLAHGLLVFKHRGRLLIWSVSDFAKSDFEGIGQGSRYRSVEKSTKSDAVDHSGPEPRSRSVEESTKSGSCQVLAETVQDSRSRPVEKSTRSDSCQSV